VARQVGMYLTSEVWYLLVAGFYFLLWSRDWLLPYRIQKTAALPPADMIKVMIMIMIMIMIMMMMMVVVVVVVVVMMMMRMRMMMMMMMMMMMTMTMTTATTYDEDHGARDPPQRCLWDVCVRSALARLPFLVLMYDIFVYFGMTVRAPLPPLATVSSRHHHHHHHCRRHTVGVGAFAVPGLHVRPLRLLRHERAGTAAPSCNGQL
jgi:hypothetical protein